MVQMEMKCIYNIEKNISILAKVTQVSDVAHGPFFFFFFLFVFVCWLVWGFLFVCLCFFFCFVFFCLFVCLFCFVSGFFGMP
jgi:hypothetical protein